MPQPLTEWSREKVGGVLPHLARQPQDLRRYAVLASYSATGSLRISTPADTRVLPETETVLSPGATLAWARRRADILDTRADIDARRIERAFARGYVVGSDTLKRDIDTRAFGVPGYGRWHIDQ